jgi:hypothetical protein
VGQKQHCVSQAQPRRFLPAVTPKGDKSRQLHVYNKVDGYLRQRPIEDLAQLELRPRLHPGSLHGRKQEAPTC